MATFARDAYPTEVTQLEACGWVYYSGDADEYPHFRKPMGFGAKRTLVFSAKWSWGVDMPQFSRLSGDKFDDPITCYIAAELAGWEL